MVDRVGFRVEGLRAVVRDLQRLGADVDDLKAAFSSIASEGAHVASRLAPRKSGRLAGDVRGNRAKAKAVVTVGRASVPYAGPINYGWPQRGIKASEFLQRADEHMQPVAVQRLETEINRAITRRGLNR